jgi:hypothetical protein
MASNPPALQDDRRGRRAEAPRRRGLGLTLSAAGVTAGGFGASYLAGVRLTYLGHLTHLNLPHVALVALIITAGVAITILGWRVIVYLDRCDRRRHETISRIVDQEGAYRKYEDDSYAYEQWPMKAVPAGEQAPRRPSRPRPPAEMNGHGDLKSPGRQHQTGLDALRQGRVANPDSGQPGTADVSRSPAAEAVTDMRSASHQLPPRSGSRRARSRRHR